MLFFIATAAECRDASFDMLGEEGTDDKSLWMRIKRRGQAEQAEQACSNAIAS
jgi:hypothetical protein